MGGQFYTTPLWTGEGCTPPNFCCSHDGMPWFCKTLPVPTTDYIEIRNCHNEPGSNENTALDLIELYMYTHTHTHTYSYDLLIIHIPEHPYSCMCNDYA